MDYLRQQDLVNQEEIKNTAITLVGCGALGSASAMALTKMGAITFRLLDPDVVSPENLPNQMYRENDIGLQKVEALARTLHDYNHEAFIHITPSRFDEFHKIITPVVIVTTDSMSSRKLVWDSFVQSPECRCLIEARMGAEEGQVYTITKGAIVDKDDMLFYNNHMYTDAEAVQAPCTAKAIIYNVFMIGALVSRSFKAYTSREDFPRLVIMSWKFMDKRSFMLVQ